MTTTSAKSFHTRSISFPSKSHPNLVQVKDNLRLVKVWEANPSKKFQLAAGLRRLKELYGSINAFLQLPLTQQTLCGKQILVTELMDDFLCLLDVCGMLRDSLSQMREIYQSLGSMIRRDDSGLQSAVSAYRCARRGMKKEMSKCIRVLKSMEKKVVSTNCDGVDTVDQIFRDARTASLSIFNLFSSIVSGGKARNSIFSRLRYLGLKIHEVDNNNGQDDMCVIEKTDVAIFGLCSDSSKLNAQRQMETSDLSLSETEEELEDFYRCLIQTKFSLLNIVTGC